MLINYLVAGKIFTSNEFKVDPYLSEKSFRLNVNNLGHRYNNKDVCYADEASSIVIKLVMPTGGIGESQN